MTSDLQLRDLELQLLGRHVWQIHETAPEELVNRYEKRIEKREKDPKNDPKRV